MTKFCTRLTFFTSLPNDAIEDEHDIVRPAGRGVTGVLLELLKNAGMEPSEPELDFEHGWEFFVKTGRREYWILVTHIDEVMVQTEDTSPIFERLFGDKDSYRDFMNVLYGLISQDSRFSSVEWFAG